MPLEGLSAPVPTLFTSDGAVDPERNARFARDLCDARVDHLFVLGSTGEFPSVTPTERGPLIEVVVESATGPTDVWVGCGAPSTAQAVAFAQEAERIGAAAIVAVAPYYLHPTFAAVDRYYRAVRKAVNVPLIAYNIPSLVGYALPPSLVHTLARDGVLAGLKDTGGSLESITAFLTGAPEGFAVFPGDPQFTSAAIERGAKGAVMGVANIVPKLCVELVAVARRGDRARSQELQPIVTRLVEVTRSGPSPSTIKFLAAHLRGAEVGYRAPYDPLTPEEQAAVLSRLEPLRELLKPFLGRLPSEADGARGLGAANPVLPVKPGSLSR
ncbi:MAG: dihydrodipicolinate synthase family protein [Thermoplasmata archaeon]|jgi:4-hydroxy-tetrahydrodipicolinate synthase